MVKTFKFIIAIFTWVIVFSLKQTNAQVTLFEGKKNSNRQITAIEPGGVTINIDSKLQLESKNLFYKEGYLHAAINEKKLKVKIDPNLLQEVLGVQKNNRNIFQISVNPTATGQVSFIDFPFRDTNEIGQAFLKADMEGLTNILRHSVELPEGAPVHPDDIAQQLLKTDTDYFSLPTKVGTPSSILIGSQTYLNFNPSAPGLVDIQFKPLILFLDVRGQYLVVDERLKRFVEKPFLPLANDISSRPLEYREILPSLEKAATITAAMGIINSGCQEIESCQHLLLDIKVEQLWQSFVTAKKTSFPTSSPSAQINLMTHWRDFSSIEWKTGNNDEAWSASYDALCQILANQGNYEVLSATKDSIAQQFQTYSAPEEPLLQAASAVVYAWDGNVKKAEQSLLRAIDLSKESIEERFEVANIGLHVSSILGAFEEQEKADKIYQNMKSIRDEAQLLAFDKIDNILKGCEFEPSSCSLNELLAWEAKTFRTGLFGNTHLLLMNSNWFFSNSWDWDVPGRDVAWLHGRFAYLVGIRLDELTGRINRLRYLESYVRYMESNIDNTNQFHLSYLKKLLKDFQDNLLVK